MRQYWESMAKVQPVNSPGGGLRFTWHDEPWKEQALCAQTDPEAFFPDKGGSTRSAKQTCAGCLVREECLEAALARDERFGIWGGLSERDRRKIKHQRARELEQAGS